MGDKWDKHGRVNIKLLLILGCVLVALGVGAFVARDVRRKILAERDLKAGLAAYEKGDWATARKRLRDYLDRRPDDVDVLGKYAEAELSVHPLSPGNVKRAAFAYRQLTRLRPDGVSVYERLAELYLCPLGKDFSELLHLAGKAGEQAEAAGSDARMAMLARLWRAKGLLGLGKFGEAKAELESLRSLLAKVEGRQEAYVECCELLATIAWQEGGAEGRKEALGYADEAVAYDPESVRGRLHRARVLRRGLGGNPGERGTDRPAGLDKGLADLAKAEERKPSDPRLCLVLVEELLAYGETARAKAELERVGDPAPDAIRKSYVDIDEWWCSRYLLAERLARKEEDISRETQSKLADEMLAKLTQKRHRYRVLPAAVRLYVNGRQMQKARAGLEEYLELVSRVGGSRMEQPDVVLLRARVAWGENRPYRVIELIRPLVVSDADNSFLWWVLAESYSRTNQGRQAIQAIRQFLQVKPGTYSMRLKLAREYAKQSQWQRAAEAARLAERMNAEDINATLVRIETAIHIAMERPRAEREKRLAGLADELAALRKKPGLEKLILIRLLQAYVAQNREGHTQEAIRELAQAIAECENTLLAEIELSRVHFRNRDLAKAIEVASEATKRHPAAAGPWQSLAVYQRLNKKPAQALATLEQGLASVKGRWQKRSIQLSLALLHITDGKRARAVALLQELVDADKREVHARRMLLRLPEIRRDASRAQELVSDIRAVEGEAGGLWRYYQAWVWLTDPQWRARQNEIIAMLKRCIESSPGWDRPALMLAGLHSDLGNLDAAEEVCRRTIAANPTAVEVADRLVALLEKQDRYGEARKVLSQLEASPAVLSARRIRTAIGAGDFGEAIQDLRVRIANDEENKDAGSRILLARLIYSETGDMQLALKYLAEANAIVGETISVLSARIAIMEAEARRKEREGLRKKEAGQLAEARQLQAAAKQHRDEILKILNTQVTKAKKFVSYLLRGSYLASIGELDLAEKDFVRLTTDFKSDRRGWAVLGDFYVRSRKIDDAIATIDEGLKAYPEDVGLKRMLCQLLLARNKAGDRARTDRVLSEVEEVFPKDPYVMWLRAQLLLRQGDAAGRSKAFALLQEVVRTEPSAVEAQLRLIALQLERGQATQARETAIRALAVNRNSIQLILARAITEHRLKRGDTALSLARMVLKQIPYNEDARRIFVETAMGTDEQGILQEAIGFEQAVAKGRPDDVQANGWLANLYCHQVRLADRQARRARRDVIQAKAEGNEELARRKASLAAEQDQIIQQAVAHAKAALDAVGKPTEKDQAQLDQARRVFIAVALATGHKEGVGKASGVLDAMIKEQPKDASLRLLSSQLHRRAGNFPAAKACIDQAQRLAPEDPAVTVERIRWLAQNRPDETGDAATSALDKRLAEVVRLLDAHLRSHPKEEMVPLAAAAFLGAAEKDVYRTKAADVYKHLIALAPGKIGYRLSLATLAQELGRTKLARAQYEAILRSKGDVSLALTGLAWILATQDRNYPAALKHADEAVRKAPKNIYALDTQGLVLMKLGKYKESRDKFQECLKLSPPGTPLRANALLQLGRVHVLLNNLSEARSLLTTALKLDALLGGSAFSAADRAEAREVLGS